MSYTYKVELNFGDGAGWLVVDNYHIIAESIKRKLCFHNNLEPNSNSLVIQLSRDFLVGSKRLIDYLLTTKDDIEIRVTRTSDGTNYLPYFAGYVSDNFKVVVSHSGIEVVELKCEDATNKLLKRPYPLNKNLVGKKVCDTSNFNQSILYQAFRTESDASYVPFDLASLPDIDNTIPVVVFSNYEDKTTYDYLKSVLYEYGYTFYFNAAGEVVVKSYKPITSPAPTTGFFNTSSVRNIYGQIEVEKNRMAYKDVTIKFQTLKTLSDVIIFTDTTGGDSINKCNIAIAAGAYYPEGADAEVNVYSEYKLETGEAILSVGDITLDVEKDSQITQVTATNLYKRANLKFRNDGASTYNIKKLDILGTSVICEDTYNKTTPKESVCSKDRMLEYETSIIHTKAEAEYLADALYAYYQNANIKYKLKSKDVFGVGDIVKLKEDAQSGIDTIGQIVEIEDFASSDIIQYTLIGASTVSVTPPLSTEWLNASPTINNTNPDQVTEQDIQDAIDAVNTVSSQQATYFSEGKGIIIPMDIYPEDGASEQNYVKLLELADRFGGLNLYVLINPKLGTPHIDDWINSPQTRPRQYYEWQNWITVIKAMKAKKIKIVTYANSTTDIDNLLAYFNVANGCTLSGIYIPEQMGGIYYSSYTPSLNTTLKALTDYAHAKSLYPVFAYASDRVHKTYFANSAADVFVYDYALEQTPEAECIAYDTATNGLALYKALVNKAYSANEEFSPSLFKTQFEYFNMVFHQPSNLLISNGGRKYQNDITTKAECVFKLTGGRAPYTYIDGYINGNPIYITLIYSQSFQQKSSCKFDLTVQPAQTSSYFGKLPEELESEMGLLAGSLSWQDVIDSAAAATPRTPDVLSSSFAGSAELYWDYQIDLGPALKYYEILISKDHDPDNSDPDNGTWYKPRNDGIDWCWEDDTDPLQLTTEGYTFVAPLDLDDDDMPVEATYFFKVRRVSTTNSGWGYASAILRPIREVEIGKNVISAPMIKAGSITADKIATGTITAAHIASVDGGAIRTGNIQSETYQQGSAGWKLALTGSAEFNDVTVRGTVYATDGTFSGSINSGPLMLNKNPPSTTSTTITSGNSVVTWVRALQSAASIIAGSFACSGTYNSTALGRLELTQTQESPVYEQWQKTGTHNVTSRIWGITGYNPPVMWVDSWGVVHVTPGGPIYGWIESTVTVEDDVLWRRTTTKYTYTLKLYSDTNTLLATFTDWYETAGTWTNTGTTGTNKSASTSAPSAASATQGTVNFAASGSVSFTATAFTYRLLNLPLGFDENYPSGTVYMDVIDANTAYLKVRR